MNHMKSYQNHIKSFCHILPMNGWNEPQANPLREIEHKGGGKSMNGEKRSNPSSNIWNQHAQPTKSL